jgi:hypothetical protein
MNECIDNFQVTNSMYSTSPNPNPNPNPQMLRIFVRTNRPMVNYFCVQLSNDNFDYF